jgi:Tol biopolymer transport system component
LNPAGDRFAFSQKVGGNANEDQEIFTMGIDDRIPQRLTDNRLWDIYPAWSPDGTRIAFLSWRKSSLGIYVMDANGEQINELYDSEFHDSDIHWSGNLIALTRNSQIWIMNDDGSDAHQLTQPPCAGEWGNANLPLGDYDPRISPDGSQVVFERMVEDRSSHGNYDLYKIDTDGSNLTHLTETGYSQGLASWSHAGDRIVYIVAAQDDVEKFDIYIMNADGTKNENITPAYFPPEFLCHWAIFSREDMKLYFIGELWSQE